MSARDGVHTIDASGFGPLADSLASLRAGHSYSPRDHPGIELKRDSQPSLPTAMNQPAGDISHKLTNLSSSSGLVCAHCGVRGADLANNKSNDRNNLSSISADAEVSLPGVRKRSGAEVSGGEEVSSARLKRCSGVSRAVLVVSLWKLH